MLKYLFWINQAIVLSTYPNFIHYKSASVAWNWPVLVEIWTNAYGYDEQCYHGTILLSLKKVGLEDSPLLAICLAQKREHFDEGSGIHRGSYMGRFLIMYSRHKFMSMLQKIHEYVEEKSENWVGPQASSQKLFHEIFRANFPNIANFNYTSHNIYTYPAITREPRQLMVLLFSSTFSSMKQA